MRRVLDDRPSPHRKRTANPAAATIKRIPASIKRTLGSRQRRLARWLHAHSMQDPVELARVHAEVDKLGGRTPTCG